jgi:glycosyltransferase involved in cell wall biosynthesis
MSYQHGSEKNQYNILKKRIGKNVKPDPRVSVVIPSYNVANFIKETLDSALAQTFRDFEVIVVNDGSPDSEDFENILQDYFDDIIYLRQENGGVSAARNSAILNSRGSLLALLDGDDVWLPHKLDAQVRFMDSNQLDLVYCDAFLFGDTISKPKTFMEKSPSNGDVTPESLLTGKCNVLASAAIVKRDIVIENGMFDGRANSFEDFDLWLRLCKKGAKIGYQRDQMLKYRIRSGSLTGDKLKAAERTLIALNLVEEKYVLTESEKEAWDQQFRCGTTRLDIEKGKINLINGNFAAAKVNFSHASLASNSLKLKLIKYLMIFSPKLLRAIFQMFRPREYSDLSPAIDTKK